MKRNTAENIGEGGSVKDGEQCGGQTKDTVEQGAPDADVDVVAELDSNAAKDEEPEHDHERKIEAAEGRGVKKREGEVERAAAGEKPDFIAVPDRADAGEGGAAVQLGAAEKEM